MNDDAGGAPSTGRGSRAERDPLGEKQLPASALYGVQTLRSLETFRISRLRNAPQFITACAEVKRAAAEANVQVGKLEKELGAVIARAATEVAEGRWREHFDLDVFQAGAGTSYNMNLNEVVANRALELLGAERSVGRAAVFNEKLGFLGAAKLAEKAVETRRRVEEVAEDDEEETPSDGGGR